MTDYIMKAEGVLQDDHSFVRLVDSMPMPHRGLPPGVTHPGDRRIVEAARVSIAGEEVRATSDDEKLIRYLIKNRHTSPLEQVVLTFHMRMPIFVARQIIRHRTARVNEESARYGKLADDFYIPSITRLQAGGQAKDNKQGSTGGVVGGGDAKAIRTAIQKTSVAAYALYEEFLKVDLARELARMVLPTNIYTQWFWQMDLHNLMHFLELRLHPHAQWETRRYGEAILPMAEAVAPYAMKAWREFVLEA